MIPKWYPEQRRPAFGAFCRDQALALTRCGLRPAVIASYAVRNPPFRLYRLTYAKEDGIPTFRVYYRRPRLRPLGLLCQLAGIAHATAKLRRQGYRPRVVHAHVYSAAIPALIVGRALRRPVVVSEHYTGFQRGLIGGYDRLLAAFAFQRASLVAPVSADLAGQLRPLAPRGRYLVVPNAVDCSLFCPRPRAGGEGLALVCVAALAAKKGHLYLLEAVAALPEPLRRRVVVDLVGEGEERERLERRAAALGLAGTVRFRGELGRSEVAAAIGGADLLVLPSLFENLPCVLLEAAASGVPFIATAVGGVPELFRAAAVRRCCRLVPAGSAKALTAAIEELAERPRERCADLVKTAQELYSYEAVGRRWQTIYATLA